MPTFTLIHTSKSHDTQICDMQQCTKYKIKVGYITEIFPSCICGCLSGGLLQSAHLLALQVILSTVSPATGVLVPLVIAIWTTTLLRVVVLYTIRLGWLLQTPGCRKRGRKGGK